MQDMDMHKDHFVALVKGFCELCEIADPISIAQGSPVETQGVHFSLVHSETINPRLLLIYSEVESVPIAAQLSAYETALKKNFFSSAEQGPVLCVEPDTSRILMAYAADLSSLTPQLLVDRLKLLSQSNLGWRADLLLARQESVPTKPDNLFPASYARVTTSQGGGMTHARRFTKDQP
jgi:hypothetical protein